MNFLEGMCQHGGAQRGKTHQKCFYIIDFKNQAESGHLVDFDLFKKCWETRHLHSFRSKSEFF